MIRYMLNPKYDELYTPKCAIYPLLQYLSKDKVIWECTDYGASNITKILKENGYKVIATQKSEFDFLKDKANFYFDVIITNPPYSLKNEFLERCYEYGKPFALLLPITTLEGIKRGKIFRDYGLELLVLDQRINYMESKNNVWFNTSWFCFNLLPKQLIFEKIVRE